eukprot:g12588.t1
MPTLTKLLEKDGFDVGKLSAQTKAHAKAVGRQ